MKFKLVEGEQALEVEHAQYLSYYDFDRVDTGRLTRSRIPAEIVYLPRKVRTR